MSGLRYSESRCFNENSPRPPVPGEETGSSISRYRTGSPALTPRRSSFGQYTYHGSCDASAPLGFEPEGRCSKATMESESPPACLRWAKNLHSLLQDPDGLELFRRYLDQEGTDYANPLTFWFACEGLKEQQDPERIHHLVKIIHRRFFQKSQLAIPEDVRKEANRRVREGRLDGQVFDTVQQSVERLINETTYPNFLRSDMYLQYVQSCQNPEMGSCLSSSGSNREMSLSCGPVLLPTLHEDSEFVISTNATRSANETPIEPRGELRLTKDILMATQDSRAMRLHPKPEAYAGLYLQAGTSPYHVTQSRPHAHYSSYNPVSRQDSELQSLSSDARTESDNLSITDSSIDGKSMSRRCIRKHYQRQYRAIKESANLNRDSMAHQTFIPRTQRLGLTPPMDPKIFALILTEKLEALKREIDNQEKLDRRLQENDSSPESPAEAPPSIALSAPANPPKALTEAFREKLHLEDDSDQAILDQHVSRVWSDLTPSRSPGLVSPRPHSPERRRGLHNYSRQHKQRKEKDVFSTFSGDSGNVHDFPEAGSDRVGTGSVSSLGSHLPKSKSVPSDYADSLHKQDLYLQGHDRFRRLDASRRSGAKKSMTELTDSGVSVVSDVPPVGGNKGNRLKYPRHTKKFGPRSDSLERGNRERDWGVPAQPFVADPGMPPLPQPHTPTQLEEARRRLVIEERNRQRYPTSSKQGYEPPPQSCIPSNQSTLKRTKPEPPANCTIVVFNFCDEQFPYRTKIPGHNVTLKMFKDVLPKKGNYRYFFKTECEDLDVKVIQEEITDENEVLPLWEGKVMAQVKSLE